MQGRAVKEDDPVVVARDQFLDQQGHGRGAEEFGRVDGARAGGQERQFVDTGGQEQFGDGLAVLQIIGQTGPVAQTEEIVLGRSAQVAVNKETVVVHPLSQGNAEIGADKALALLRRGARHQQAARPPARSGVEDAGAQAADAFRYRPGHGRGLDETIVPAAGGGEPFRRGVRRLLLPGVAFRLAGKGLLRPVVGRLLGRRGCGRAVQCIEDLAHFSLS